MTKNNKIGVYFLFVAIAAAAYYLGTINNNVVKNGFLVTGDTTSTDIYSWSRPNYPYSTGLPITKSAICSFSKTFLTYYTYYARKTTNEESDGNQQQNTPPPDFIPDSQTDRYFLTKKIYYTYGDDNQADTVSFANLDTDTPTVITNEGSFQVFVFGRGENIISMTSNAPTASSFNKGAWAMWTLYPKDGIVVYNDSNIYLLTGPASQMEMGYCH